MSRERSQLPEVASADALWIRPPTLPGEGMTRGGAPAETDWQHYFSAVRRRKWLVLAITVVGTTLGLVASRLLRQGRPLKEIADVLRHRSLDTSAIYTKVDDVRLAAIALPWPGRTE